MLRSFFRGDTYLVRLRIRDADDLPVDITNWLLYVTLKLDRVLADSASGVAQLAVDLSIADDPGLIYRDLNAEAGVVTLRLGPELTKLLTGGEIYQLDVQRVLPFTHDGGEDGTILDDHDVWTLVSDTVRVLDDVTKSYLQGTLGEAI